MQTFINTEHHKFSYQLLLISEMNYRLFLSSENPEVKMLALLADLSNTDSYSVVKEVVEEIKEHAGGDFAESRYFKQLRIFVQLRSSIQPQFEKVMQTVSQFFREEKDFLFKRGVEKERARAEAKVLEEKRNIAREFKKLGVPIADISKGTDLSIEEIEKL